MTELADLLGSSLELVASKWEVAAALQAKAVLGGSALQPDHLAALPVQEFTPGGVALSDSNIVAAIEAARLYAVSKGGGRVCIPLGPHGGLWSPSAGAAIPGGSVITGQKALVCFRNSGNLPLFLEGAPGAGFNVPADCNVGVYFMSPDNTGGSPGFAVHHGGGMRNLIASAVDGTAICEGFRINAAVNCLFEQLTSHDFNGSGGGDYGAGFRINDDWAGGSGNSQFCRFMHCMADTNQMDWHAGAITRSHFLHCHSQGATYRAWVLDGGADVALYNSGIQESGLSTFVEIVGNGFFSAFDCYTEGHNPSATLFKASSLTGYSSFMIHRYRNTDTYSTIFDVPGACSVVMTDCYLNTDSVCVLRCHPGSDPSASRYLFLNNINQAFDAADALDSSKFDIDQYARKRLYIGCGGQTYNGGELFAGQPVRLASFAQGSEPASADGQITHNATTGRPRYRGASASRDLAYADDGTTVAALLKPYSSEIIDPAFAKSRVIVSTELDSINGLIDPASSAVPVNSSRRPLWHASDDFFAGKPSFECANTGDRMLTLTLNTPVPIGSRAGVFLIMRATGSPIPDTGLVRPILYDATSGQFELSGEDSNWADAYVSHNHLNSGGTQFASTTFGIGVGNNAFAHVLYAGARPTDNAYRISIDGHDGTYDGPTADLGVTTRTLSQLYLGALGTGSGNSANVAFAFIAILNQPLPPAIANRAITLAMNEYGIGI